MRRFILIIATLVSLFIAQASQANPHWFASIGLGYALTTQSTANHIANGSPLDDIYTVTSTSNSTVGVLAGGLQFSTSHRRWFPAYNLNMQLQSSSNATVKGEVWQFGLLDNYHYHYKIQRNTLLLGAQLDIIHWHHWSPHLNFAFGLSENKASAYSETANPGLQLTRVFSIADNTQNQVAYEAGFGTAYQISTHNSVNLDVNYLDAGEASFGKTSGYNSGLSQKLASTTVALSYRYTFK
jgi:opacity protein-like surface antigen